MRLTATATMTTTVHLEADLDGGDVASLVSALDQLDRVMPDGLTKSGEVLRQTLRDALRATRTGDVTYEVDDGGDVARG